MLTIYSISIKFTPRKMMLKIMNFRKSPGQHPKPSLPSLTHHVFENQHSWSRFPISTYSFPNPRRLLQQLLLIVLPKITCWQLPSQSPKTTFPSLKHHAFQNPTYMSKVASCHQLMPRPWHIVTQSTCENNVSKSKTSRLSNTNIYEQGIQLPPTHAPFLEDCYGIRSWS